MDVAPPVDLQAHIEDCIFCASNGDKWLAVMPYRKTEYQIVCPRCNMRGPTQPTFNGAIDIYNEAARVFGKKLIRRF